MQNMVFGNYFHRLFELWTKANIPEEDRVTKFYSTVLLEIANALHAKKYSTVCEVLDDARRVEEARAENLFYHPPRTTPASD
ncbi:hypothetical protein FE257_011766 [Aspergillus nanangensis]|uniref:Uncharacterized protein n=1 Tax=Aspergillus nanangensis TaxID=2582783 RepID=A0AAD4CV73_ASPNN|nr:hypothetical protein FE257_011766 [Aspergillus nanangensis]